MVNGATLTFFLIMLTHSFGTLIYLFIQGVTRLKGVC
jgi:hypothetical protein